MDIRRINAYIGFMSDQLYNTRILRLAASIPHQERLEAPQATVQKVSPICGSRVTVDMALENGVVARFGQEVRACALGQAAASLVGRGIIGRSAAELSALRDAMRAFLAGEAVDWAAYEGGRWADLEIFAPAVAFKSRHGSILLAFEASAEAALEAEQKAEAPA